MSPAATLAVDEAGRVWVGDAGVLVALDSLGRTVARFPLPGAPPRLLRMHGRRLWVSRGPRGVAIVDAATGRVEAQRTASRPAPLAVDPRGQWVYTSVRRGAVLGLDTLLVPRWGWPDVGADAAALAVSRLGDRVYVGVVGTDAVDPGVQVRDAFSGRVLAAWEASEPVRGLEAGADGRVYGWDDGGVFALRHTVAGLEEAWRVSLGGVDLERVDALRVSPTGERLALLARGEGGGVRVLDAADGRVVGREGEAPPDAAWDVRGRLLVLGEREVRVSR